MTHLNEKDMKNDDRVFTQVLYSGTFFFFQTQNMTVDTKLFVNMKMVLFQWQHHFDTKQNESGRYHWMLNNNQKDSQSNR